MRAFSTYAPYSRAAPEIRTLARARVIPITPAPVMTAITTTVTRSSTIEKPPFVHVFVFTLFFRMPIINSPKRNLWSNVVRPRLAHGAIVVPQKFFRQNSTLRSVELTGD